MRQIARFAFLIIALLSCSHSVHAATLLAVSWEGDVFSIDAADGSAQSVGSTGFTGLNSLARNSSDEFFSVSGNPLFTSDSTLLRISASTGAGTDLGVIAGLPAGSVRALAFSPKDDLYAVINGGGPFSIGVPDDLYLIDTAAQSASFIGNTGFGGLQGLAFAADGTLYGWDVGDAGLVTLDASTGSGTDVNALIGEGGADIQALAVGFDGTLYGAHNALYAIDPATGSASGIGSGGYADLRGIDYSGTPSQGGGAPPGSPALPEPHSLWLIGLGLAGAAAFWRRR